ncbi:MAG: 4-hydroxy-tetrahydrodipicolinate synthase [Bdellovibrionota bacterium]|nr:4-hydroxy-tetrahydrodipicolinate synthase [Pseudobdellovibrionaceae bacterium]|tara:strand:+ start:11333 stop:12205 length:873 start_codon:yes stop_codon:yes gene_type:complete
MNFNTVMTAIVSPFKENQLDLDSFKKLLNFQWDNGVTAIVINGTTGESPTLEWSEIEEQVRVTRELKPEMKIVLGVGGNATDKVIQNLKKAESLNPDGILSVVPYYNKPTQEGLKQHFSKIAQSTKLPILLYNVPGRTITSLAVETVVELSKIENIVGIKEASGKPDLFEQYKDKTSDDFALLSGDDGTYLESIFSGCTGVISVISHVIPKEFVSWTKQAKEGDRSCLQEFEKYMAFCDQLFAEPNPVPVKESLKHMNILETAEVRLPLVACTSGHSEILKSELKKLGVL